MWSLENFRGPKSLLIGHIELLAACIFSAQLLFAPFVHRSEAMSKSGTASVPWTCGFHSGIATRHMSLRPFACTVNRQYIMNLVKSSNQPITILASEYLYETVGQWALFIVRLYPEIIDG